MIKKENVGIRVIKPDSTYQDKKYEHSIFLAGSIEMGEAEDWQEKISNALIPYQTTIFNPRRKSWNSSLEQKQSVEQFNHQVNWELDKLDECDIIFMNILGETKSPITLLELGAYSKSGKIIVCCGNNFWRRGNVEIICTRNDIPLFDNIEDALGSLLTKIRKLKK